MYKTSRLALTAIVQRHIQTPYVYLVILGCGRCTQLVPYIAVLTVDVARWFQGIVSQSHCPSTDQTLQPVIYQRSICFDSLRHCRHTSVRPSDLRCHTPWHLITVTASDELRTRSQALSSEIARCQYHWARDPAIAEKQRDAYTSLLQFLQHDAASS